MLSKIQMAETVNQTASVIEDLRNYLYTVTWQKTAETLQEKRSDVSRIIKKRSTIATFNIYFLTDSNTGLCC